MLESIKKSEEASKKYEKYIFTIDILPDTCNVYAIRCTLYVVC